MFVLGGIRREASPWSCYNKWQSNQAVLQTTEPEQDRVRFKFLKHQKLKEH